MLGFELTMSVYENLSLLAHLPLPLGVGEQLATVSASVEQVVAVGEKKLQLLHVDLTFEFVFFVFDVVQGLDINFVCQALDQGAVHAVHVDWEQQYVLQVLPHKHETLLNQGRHLKEVRRYEDRDGVFDVELWLETVQILHQPVEYRDVAVDRDVDIIERLLLREVLLKVFHVVQEQILVALEILGLLFCLIAHVDQHSVGSSCLRRHCSASGWRSLGLVQGRGWFCSGGDALTLGVEQGAEVAPSELLCKGCILRNAAHFLPVTCRAGSIFEHLILLVEVHLVTGLVVSAFVVGADVV